MRSSIKKGFTLIELLIVIAIIGILASILVISLRQASDNSKNTKIITNLVEIRKIAEQIYIEKVNGYEDLCVGTNLNTSEYDVLGVLKTDIELYAGADSITCQANRSSYCVSSSLVGGLEYICIDDEGNAIEVDSNPCVSADSICQ